MRAEAEQKEKDIINFVERLRSSEDLNDNLQELVDKLKTQTNATAVYVGKLIQPTKPIDEKSMDDAHLNPDAEQLIKFLYTNEEHQFLVDKTLRQD